jgi:hypothetical protein
VTSCFRWPTVAYALGILPWDFFFALSMFFAAPVLSRLATSIRVLMIVSGMFALAGLMTPQVSDDAVVVAGDRDGDVARDDDQHDDSHAGVTHSRTIAFRRSARS